MRRPFAQGQGGGIGEGSLLVSTGVFVMTTTVVPGAAGAAGGGAAGAGGGGAAGAGGGGAAGAGSGAAGCAGAACA
ncbi:MAG: hypothetical protein WDO69_00930 [Pseudomonadota bacterium]